MSSNWRDSIPIVPISQAHVDDKAQCTICLEDFKFSELVRKLDCAHVFHDPCIDPWLNKHNICPTCRRLTVSGNDESETFSDHFLMDTDEEDSDDYEVVVTGLGSDFDSVEGDEDSMLSLGSSHILQISDSENPSLNLSPSTAATSDEEDVFDIDSSDHWEEVSEHSAEDCPCSETETHSHAEDCPCSETETHSQPVSQPDSGLNVTVEMDDKNHSEYEDEASSFEDNYSDAESLICDSD